MITIVNNKHIHVYDRHIHNINNIHTDVYNLYNNKVCMQYQYVCI